MERKFMMNINGSPLAVAGVTINGFIFTEEQVYTRLDMIKTGIAGLEIIELVPRKIATQRAIV